MVDRSQISPRSNFNPAPSFWVGDVPVFGDLILSPMDGVSDYPFRSLARDLGSAMSYTEFINARDVINGHPHLDARLKYSESERPVVYQIFDDDPERLVTAAQILRERNPDIIDINMGCSAKTVTSRGAGACLLREPSKIAEIFSRLTKSLDIPITGKIRLGWSEETRNYLEIARIIEENGGKLIAVHGRTKEQGYGGTADWEPIAEVKRAVSIPVIGNGDVRSVADIEHLQSLTGCDGVMIGRAAIGNPWIFSRRDREQVPLPEVQETMLHHLEKNLSFYSPEFGLVLFRKYASRYISPYPLDRDVRLSLLTCTQPEEFIAILHQLLENSDNLRLLKAQALVK